jgi:hypothetical protein
MSNKVKEEKHSLFDKQAIAYGFLEYGGDYDDKTIGGYLSEIFKAIDEYEQYIAELDE